MNNQITPGNVLTWGIVALAFSASPILGLIFAFVANGKVKAFKSAHGGLMGTAKVGNILTKIALPVSIVMHIFWVLYIVAIVAALSM